MKTNRDSLRIKQILIVLIISSILTNGCVNLNRLCTRKTQKSVCGCDPIKERHQMVLMTYKIAGNKEVSKCIENLNISAKIKNIEYVNTTIEGCYKMNSKSDSISLKPVYNHLNSLPLLTDEHNKWYDCKYGNEGPTERQIILMDSHEEGCVYCIDTYSKGGSNTDDILKVLSELHLIVHTIPTNINWSDEQRVIDLTKRIYEETEEPALIIIHASAFYSETKEIEANKKLIIFLESLKNENVRILVYTRGLPADSPDDLEQRFENVVSKVDELKSKANLFVIKYPDPCFNNAEVSITLRNKIRDILALD